MGEDIEEQLRKYARAPVWVSRWLAPVLGFALLLADLFEVPERLGIEPPASDLITASLGGFLLWLWLVRGAVQWGPALGALLTPAAQRRHSRTGPPSTRVELPLLPLLLAGLALACAFIVPRLALAYTAGPGLDLRTASRLFLGAMLVLMAVLSLISHAGEPVDRRARFVLRWAAAPLFFIALIAFALLQVGGDGTLARRTGLEIRWSDIALYLFSAAWIVFVAACGAIALAAIAGKDAARQSVLAIRLGAGIALIVFLAALFRPEDWYLVSDTLLSDRVATGHTGILIAPYDFDKDGTEHQRLSQEVQDLLARDTSLRTQLELELLPRRIPGYPRTGSVALNGENEQAAVARKIAFYLGGSIVAYGADLKKLTRTKIVTTAGERDLLLPRELEIDGPKQDAGMLHFLATTIVGLAEARHFRLASAERYFDDALNAAKALSQTPAGRQSLRPATMVMLRLLKGAVIVQQVYVSTAARARADEALQIFKEVRDDPASTSYARAAAAVDTGMLWRNLSQFDASPAAHQHDLDEAAAAYMQVLGDIPPDADPFAIATAWNGIGVVYEKLAGRTNELEPLQKAEAAYQNALLWQAKTSRGENARSRSERASLLASVKNNLGIVLTKEGRKTGSAAKLKLAIAAYGEARAALLEYPDPALEPLLISNLADAYTDLSGHENASENLRRARELLLQALALPGAAYPAVRGEIIFKLGQVDVVTGGFQDGPDAWRGVRELACSFDIFHRAGRGDQVRTVLNTLKQINPEILRPALLDKTPPVPDCSWDGTAILSALSS